VDGQACPRIRTRRLDGVEFRAFEPSRKVEGSVAGALKIDSKLSRAIVSAVAKGEEKLRRRTVLTVK
jgi:hypothetical protein